MLYEIYEIYYRLFNRKWTIESRLKMMRLQAEYAEQQIRMQELVTKGKRYG